MYNCIEMHGVTKHQNIMVLRDQHNKAYPEDNILTIVKLLKSCNRNKVKVVCDGKVPSYIKHNAVKPHRPTTHTPQPTMCSRCHGYHPGIYNNILSCSMCGCKHEAKSYTCTTLPIRKGVLLYKTIHAQEGKSCTDCLKQSWNTSRILT
jgi:hypothetical protein